MHRTIGTVLLAILFWNVSLAAISQDQGAQPAEIAGVPDGFPLNGQLPVFSLPTQDAPKLGFLVNGEAVTLVERISFFAKITCSKIPEGGYVLGNFIKVKTPETPDAKDDPFVPLMKKDEPPLNQNRMERLKQIFPMQNSGPGKEFLKKEPVKTTP